MKVTYMICLLSLLAGMVSAQSFEVVERRNFWNTGANVTGIRLDSVTISYAEIYGRGINGGFRNSYEASKAWSGGVVAQTITHLEKYSMIGSFSFDHTSGHDMNGSMFINPGSYPVDVLEFTPGRKDLQTYSFMGGISADIDPKWRLGGKFDFVAANYAKRKDLRHTNYRLDMKVAPGVMYHCGQWAVGFSYIFGKNSETIKAEEVGNSADSYYAFLDKGLMYGAYETWEGSGIHLSESGINGFPVKEISHGAAIQLQYGSFYADVEYLYSSGSVGEKETIWFEFPKHSISSHVGYRVERGATSHFARLNIVWSHQVNNENILGKETSDGITITHKYGSNRIFEREVFTVNPEYEFTAPKGDLRFGIEISSLKRLTTQMYPYVATQSMTCIRAYVSGTLHAGKFDLKAGAAFASGNFVEKSRDEKTPAEPGDPPYRLTEYYNIQNEYLTAPRVRIQLGLRYNFMRGMYAEVEAGVTRGFNLQHIEGANRWSGALKFGYTF